MIMTLGAAARRRARWLAWRWLTWHQPGRNLRVTLPGGGLFDQPLRSAIGRLMMTEGFEVAELAFMRGVLRPGDTMIDVGANAGLHCVVAGCAVGPRGRVIAFEPIVREQGLLRHNLALNSLENVSIVPSAVSDKTGSARFAMAEDGALSSLAQNKHPWQRISAWQEVPVTTLDAYVAREHTGPVAFLKIDVEGAEKLVLAGASRLLADNPGITVLFEALDVTTAGFGYSTHAFLRSLQTQGYALSYLDAKGALAPVRQMRREYGTHIYNFVLRHPARPDA